MDVNLQSDKAQAFRKMHDRSRILVLPNAWDAASARIIEEAGARAIATSSAGVANALGYADGEALPRAEMIAATTRIARSVGVPVTADIEAAYGRDAKEVAETIKLVIEAGAVGINLQDSSHDRTRPLHDLPIAVDRIRAAREAAASAGVPIVINARTDAFVAGVGAPESRFDEATRRLNSYLDAGADSLFLPGVRDRDAIARAVKALKGPLNILAGPGFPTVSELEQLGVARVSVGGWPSRVAMTITRRIAAELLGAGTYTPIDGLIGHPEMEALISRRPR
ncbi:MAG TPA: isocitrate lyase/phosphoenolpyruvate mutase family protein [Candidatus Binataceae bacterium]